eukprot:scaffold217883_cov46-Prasinocladus_malaysianus.AAC.1
MALYLYAINWKIKLMKATANEMTAFTWLFAAHVLFFTVLFCWSLDVDGLIAKRFKLAFRSATVTPSPTQASPHGSVETMTASKKIQSAFHARSLKASSDSSFKHRHIQIMTSLHI